MFGDLDKVVNTIGKMVGTIEQLIKTNEQLITAVSLLSVRVAGLESAYRGDVNENTPK